MSDQTATKIDELNRRIDTLEQRASDAKSVEQQIKELIEVLGIVLDAVTYMSGAVERLRVDMLEEKGWRR